VDRALKVRAAAVGFGWFFAIVFGFATIGLLQDDLRHAPDWLVSGGISLLWPGLLLVLFPVAWLAMITFGLAEGWTLLCDQLGRRWARVAYVAVLSLEVVAYGALIVWFAGPGQLVSLSMTALVLANLWTGRAMLLRPRVIHPRREGVFV
jgi:hypothetical protein